MHKIQVSFGIRNVHVTYIESQVSLQYSILYEGKVPTTYTVNHTYTYCGITSAYSRELRGQWNSIKEAKLPDVISRSGSKDGSGVAMATAILFTNQP